MPPVATEYDIRRAIAGLLKTAAPLARIWDRWVLKNPLGENLNLLKSSDDQQRVHCWMVKRGAFSEEKTGQNLRVREAALFNLWAFHYYDLGTESTNSEKLFNREIDAVRRALRAAPQLGLDYHGGVESHDGLQGGAIDVLHFAKGGQVHYAECDLTVYLKDFNC